MNPIGKLAEAIVRIAVDASGLTSGLDKAKNDTAKSMNEIAGVVGQVKTAATIAFTAGAAAIGVFVKEAAEAEGVGVRLRSTLAGIGAEAVAQQPKIDAWAEALMKASDFDDEDIIGAFREMLSLTGDVAASMEAVDAATNLANQSGETLAATSGAIMGAYNGQTRALKGMGVALDEGVKGFDAIDAVMKKVQGANENTAASTERATRRMQTEWGNAREALGNGLLPLAIKVMDYLTGVAAKFNNLSAEQQAGYAKTLLWTTGIVGAIAVIAQITQAVLQFRANLALLNMAQQSATVSGTSFAGILKGIPGWAAAAAAALYILVEAFKAVEREQAAISDSFNNKDSGKGGRNTFIRTGEGLETPGEIAQETSSNRSDGAPDGLFFADAWIMAQEALHGRDARSQKRTQELIDRERQVRGRSHQQMLPATAGSAYDNTGGAGLTQDGLISHRSNVQESLNGLTGVD